MDAGFHQRETAKHSWRLNEHYWKQNHAEKKEQNQCLDDACRFRRGTMSRGGELGTGAEVEDETVTTGTDGTGTGSQPGWES